MHRRFRQIVAWVTLAQVALVGAVGTGLHGLFGCEHGPHGHCSSACCASPSDEDSQCEDCVFCQRRDALGEQATPCESGMPFAEANGGAWCCDGCVVCDLLAQYHSVTPLALDPLSIELAVGEAAIQIHNAVVSAASRLALSRGPPVA